MAQSTAGGGPAAPTAEHRYSYNSRQLRVYDTLVVRASNTLLWRCGRRHLQAQYDRWVSGKHLEVGLGTGYYLDHCRFTAGRPDLTLLDEKPGPLRFSAARLARYAPTTVQADVREPLPVGLGYASIGFTHVLHCVPPPPDGKQRIIGHLAAVLAPDGVLFGATILTGGVRHTPLSRAVSRFYQRHGIFHNAGDSLEMLDDAFRRHFARHRIVIRGCVALFVARQPNGGEPPG